MDIAPLGFAVDTAPLDRGKKAADDFARGMGGLATALNAAAAAHIAETKAAAEAARKAADVAAAKLNLARTTEGVSKKAIEEAAALARSTRAAADAARATYDLAAAGESAEQALDGLAGSGGMLGPVLQGVTREAAAMATQMGLGGAAGRLGMAGAMGAAQGAASRLTPALSVLGTVGGRVAGGAAALVAGYVALSSTLADNQDRWASYTQQLTNTLGSQGAAQQALYEVVDLANEVGISVDVALQSFNRFARAKAEIGATNEQLVLMTETIMKLGRAGGTETGAMQGAMMQLSQALASGRLNGDELRSIMENMQPLAKAIADGLGVGVGQLKRMGAEGDLTADKIFEALLSQADEADEAFATMPRTVEQSKTRMNNAFDEMGAKLGELIGASAVMRTIYDGIGGAAESINGLFRDIAEDGMSAAERKARELEERVEGIENRAKAALEELNKQFNKDTNQSRELDRQRETAQANVRLQQQQITISREQMTLEAANLRQQESVIRRMIQMRAGAEAAGNTRLAQTLDRDLRERVSAFEGMQDRIRRANEALEDLNVILPEIDRQQQALARNSPFERLGVDIADMTDALANAKGGMVQMRLEALEMARTTGKSVEQIMELQRQLAMLRAEDEVRGREMSASRQGDLARQIASGGDRISAEAAAEAAEWAFNKFGDTVDQNTGIVQRYTEALIAMKRATEALGDATEIARLKNQLEELAAITGIITQGGGGYAERLARLQIGNEQFRRERASAPPPTAAPSAAPTATGTASSRQLPADIVAFFRAKGVPEHVAQGIAAGIMSESSGNHNAFNRASGAIGLGQWLGPRKREIQRRFGSGGLSRQEQLEFLWWELNGGDHGGPAVLQGGNAADVASRYIGGFMRPGRDTASGTARALRYLGLTPGEATASAAATPPPMLTEDVIRGRTDVFNAQEAERLARFMAGQAGARDGLVERIGAVRSGSDAAIREAELRLRVIEAQRDFAPEAADAVEDEVRRADALERSLQAEQQIFDLRRANEQGARRAAAARTGDPAVMRQLELELRIEEIRRTAPADQQERLIAEARIESQLRTDEAFARAEGSLENQRRQMRDQLEVMGLVGDEARIQNALLQARNQLFQMGVDLSSEQARQFLDQVEALERQQIAMDRLAQLYDNARQTARDLGDAFAEFMGTAAREGELHWRTALRGIEDAFYGMLDRVIEQFVTSPLVDILTQLAQMGLQAAFGSMGTGKPGGGGKPVITNIANGAAFGPGGIEPYASGGVFNSPTRFMFGGGRQGLAGEGPGLYEGILPLKRGADGRLGVSAAGAGGGNTTVQIIDQRSAGNSEAVEVEERQSGDGMRQIRVMVRDAVRETTRSGALDADMRGSYGISRTSTRR